MQHFRFSPHCFLAKRVIWYWKRYSAFCTRIITKKAAVNTHMHVYKYQTCNKFHTMSRQSAGVVGEALSLHAWAVCVGGWPPLTNGTRSIPRSAVIILSQVYTCHHFVIHCSIPKTCKFALSLKESSRVVPSTQTLFLLFFATNPLQIRQVQDTLAL